jgi:cell division protein FtsB
MNIRPTNLKPRHQQAQRSLSWRSVNIFLVVVCLVFGVTYLVGMNDLTVKGFALKDLKSRTNLLAAENQDLQARVLTLQSYTALSPRLRGLDMVAVEDVAYFSPQTPVVAKK